MVASIQWKFDNIAMREIEEQRKHWEHCLYSVSITIFFVGFCPFMFMINQTLTQRSLGSQITDNGVQHLVEALKINK
ncbi:unnamed protein product, partial [Rotaria magnacalcarata]